jgi:hypothetical protein
VLETIAAIGSLISLGEASRRTGLHRSTTHHLLQSLVGVGYVRQDKKSRGYELTSKLFELTGRMWTPEQLGEIAQPFVADLTRTSGEGASMAAYRDGTVSIVAKRDAEGPVRVVQSVGAAPSARYTRRQSRRPLWHSCRRLNLRACCRGYATRPLRHGPSRRRRRSPRNLSAFGCPVEGERRAPFHGFWIIVGSSSGWMMLDMPQGR